MIKVADQVDRLEWDIYVQRHEFGSVFHTAFIYDVYSHTPGFEAVSIASYDDTGQITGILTGFIQTVRQGLLSALSTRGVFMQSPIYSDPQSLEEMIREYCRIYGSRLVYTEIRDHYQSDDLDRSYQENKAQREGHYNIVLELPGSHEELWKQIGRKRKDGINKGKRFGYTLTETVEPDTVATFYALLVGQYGHIGLPIPPQIFFENCLSYDISGYSRIIRLVDSGRERISLLGFIHKETFYAFYIGIDQDPEFINKRPVDWFYYEVMKWCIDRGIKYFDWMGAGKPGVEYGVRDFKLQYGGELIDFGRRNIIHSEMKYKIAKLGFEVARKVGRI